MLQDIRSVQIKDSESEEEDIGGADKLSISPILLPNVTKKEEIFLHHSIEVKQVTY